MPMPSYGIDPALSRLFPGGAKKKNAGAQETWPIGDELAGFAGMLPGQAGVSEALQTSLLAALQGKFPEEYFATAIADPLRSAFEREGAPAIREEFVGPGTYWGTARAGEVTKGRRKVEEDITAKRAGLAYQTQQQALQAALAYLGISLMGVYEPHEEGGSSLQNKLSGGFKSATGNKSQVPVAPEWDPTSLVSKLAYWDYYNIPEEERYPSIGDAIAKMLKLGTVKPYAGPTPTL